MRRTKALTNLSRDHHHGLLLAWKIRQGLNKHVELQRIADYVTYFFRQHLEPHLLDEEIHVMPLLEDGHKFKLRTFAEHDELRALATKIAITPDADSLVVFANLLEAHIRFEERELFQYLQEHFQPALDTIADMMEGIRHDHALDWQDEFWK